MSLRSEPPHGHVVVGTDGSRVATHALDQAAGEAHRRQVPLEIVHAWPWGGAYEPLDDDPQDILAKAAQHVTDRSPGLQVTTTAIPDDAAEVLVQRSRTAALTVVGTRGNGGFKGLLQRGLSKLRNCSSAKAVEFRTTPAMNTPSPHRWRAELLAPTVTMLNSNSSMESGSTRRLTRPSPSPRKLGAPAGMCRSTSTMRPVKSSAD
ncbi:universal stress protein [Streptomyces sp. WAC01490]